MGKQTSTSSGRIPRPAISPEAREKQLVSHAIDLAEKQLLDGTASAQVISHFLKVGSITAQTENDILHSKKMLIDAKVQAIQSGVRVEELYSNALKAMTSYGGKDEYEDED